MGSNRAMLRWSRQAAAYSPSGFFGKRQPIFGCVGTQIRFAYWIGELRTLQNKKGFE